MSSLLTRSCIVWKRSIWNVTSLVSIRKEFSTMSSPSPNHSNDSPYYTIAITGASGVVATSLIDELTSGKTDRIINGKPLKIIKLIRSSSIKPPKIDNDKELVSTLPWNPNPDVGADTIDKSALESIDTVLHLAGENIANGLVPVIGPLGLRPWSDAKKDLILTSRTRSTEALARAISQCSTPTNFLVASGISIYGCDAVAPENAEHDSIKPADEGTDVSSTTGFLPEVSRMWESASVLQKIAENEHGRSRVVNFRFGVVLSKKGGALAKLYPVFYLGGGGIVGTGRQYFPYISARDAARAIVHTMETSTLEGPVNVIAPTPATNSELTRALGKVLWRPTFLPLPEFVVKLAFGEMGEETLLGGTKAVPKKLIDSGFEFKHNTITEACESAIKESI